MLLSENSALKKALEKLEIDNNLRNTHVQKIFDEEIGKGVRCCSLVFSTEENLRVHMKRVHSQSRHTAKNACDKDQKAGHKRFTAKGSDLSEIALSAYMKRREKNNEAARQSRHKKMMQDEQERAKLLLENTTLKRAIGELQNSKSGIKGLGAT